MLGLVGGSGVGKTTLAKAYSELSGLKFVASDVRGAHEKLGISAKDDISFHDRLIVQHEILEMTERSYAKSNAPFVSDRTPIDFIAYTLADVGRDTLGEGQSAELFEYIDRCYDVTNKYFSAVVLIHPGIQMVSDGVRPSSVAYSEHISTLALGLISSKKLSAMCSFINRDVLDLEKRVDVIKRVMLTLTKKTEEEVGLLTVH